ncbi:IMPACT family protein [Pseudomonas sp. R2.Fl]|nr:IMPACT family protein [Pseudomonas sp. R2.Fl]
MQTLTRPARFEQEIRKSRFLANAAPVSSEDEAKAFLASVGDTSANHNCWAYRLGGVYRFNDDGEPSGTAGKPILQAIDGQEMDGVAVVVTRWFGGILLGSGGLIRAYGGTAASCLKLAEKTEIIATTRRIIACGFGDLALVKARLTAITHVTIAGESYDGEGAVLTVDMPESRTGEIGRLVIDLTSGRARISGEE